MVNGKTRIDLKMEAKNFINRYPNIKFMFIPLIILTLIQIYTQDNNNVQVVNNSIQSLDYSVSFNTINLIVSWLLVFVEACLSFKILDYLRNPEEYEKLTGTEMLMSLFNGLGKYALNIFLVSLVSGIFIILGYIALIVPGIILMLGYSQVFYIIKDKTDNNNYSGVMDTLSESFRLMKGHKGDFFVLGLSFIGWYFVVGITFGIAGIWVYPYVYITQTLFYENLKEEKGLL